MRLIDADTFDKVLEDAQNECKKGDIVIWGTLGTVRHYLHKFSSVKCWISTKDRLPEPNNSVLITVWDNDRKYEYRTVAWLNTCDGTTWDSNDASFMRGEEMVTHWMPLPEPPEEEDYETN